MTRKLSMVAHVVNRLIQSVGVWPVGFILAFLGALVWAQHRDPFQRFEFEFKNSKAEIVKGIAILPRPFRPMPVVVFIHDLGSSVLHSGIELRQMAELGLAAVGVDYDATDSTQFNARFSSLLDYLQAQRWAQTNAIVWAGAGFGAQRLVEFAFAEPNRRPQLLVVLGGGRTNNAYTEFKAGRTAPPKLSQALLIYGDTNEVAEARPWTDALIGGGFQVDMKTLVSERPEFEPERSLLFRVLGEYIVRSFVTTRAPAGFGAHRKLGQSLIFYWIPALAWVGYGLFVKSRGYFASCHEYSLSFTRREKSLLLAAGLALLLGLTLTAIHQVTPRCPVNDLTIPIARRFLIQPLWRQDFDELVNDPAWRGQRMGILLEHVELANYEQELMYRDWKFEHLERELYSSYVLSPRISPGSGEDVYWRRLLWESFYPRIKKERSTLSSAQVIVRHLRERITIDSRETPAQDVRTIWLRQITDMRGFERIYVAALRATGIPARLNTKAAAEFWTGNEWNLAPRPAIESWEPPVRSKSL